MLLTNSLIGSLTILAFLSSTATAQDDCDEPCNDYNNILVGCNFEADQEDVYLSCVCNDSTFGTSIDACISCVGTDSNAEAFKKACKKVPADCTSACQEFGSILSNCGDTSDPGYADCICSGAYDEQSSNTFNEQFMDCVNCENGGGIASYWESYCCATTGGCNGMSSEASQGVKSIKATLTTSQPAPTTAAALSTSTSGGFAAPTLGVDRELLGLAAFVPIGLGFMAMEF